MIPTTYVFLEKYFILLLLMITHNICFPGEILYTLYILYIYIFFFFFFLMKKIPLYESVSQRQVVYLIE